MRPHSRSLAFFLPYLVLQPTISVAQIDEYGEEEDPTGDDTYSDDPTGEDGPNDDADDVPVGGSAPPVTPAQPPLTPTPTPAPMPMPMPAPAPAPASTTPVVEEVPGPSPQLPPPTVADMPSPSLPANTPYDGEGTVIGQPTSIGPAQDPPTNNGGAIAGGVIGGILGAAALAGLVFWYMRKKKGTGTNQTTFPESYQELGRSEMSNNSHPPAPAAISVPSVPSAPPTITTHDYSEVPQNQQPASNTVGFQAYNAASSSDMLASSAAYYTR